MSFKYEIIQKNYTKKKKIKYIPSWPYPQKIETEFVLTVFFETSCLVHGGVDRYNRGGLHGKHGSTRSCSTWTRTRRQLTARVRVQRRLLLDQALTMCYWDSPMPPATNQSLTFVRKHTFLGRLLPLTTTIHLLL